MTQNVEKLTRWLHERGGRGTARELQHSTSAYATAEEAQAALNGLVQAGIGHWALRPAGAKGGRPTRECVLIDMNTPTESRQVLLREASRALRNLATILDRLAETER